jgi:hypothetical protein
MIGLLTITLTVKDEETNNQQNTSPNDSIVVEATSTVIGALDAIVNEAVKKASAHIKAMIFIKGNVGGALQVGIATSNAKIMMGCSTIYKQTA